MLIHISFELNHLPQHCYYYYCYSIILLNTIVVYYRTLLLSYVITIYTIYSNFHLSDKCGVGKGRPNVLAEVKIAFFNSFVLFFSCPEQLNR